MNRAGGFAFRLFFPRFLNETTIGRLNKRVPNWTVNVMGDIRMSIGDANEKI